MAAVAFDSIDYAHQLEKAGMPREQAEVVAKGLTTMFIHNFESLATKDYLDSRFSEFETRIVAKMDRRFSGVDAQFVSIDSQFSNIDTRFVEMDTRFDRIDTRFDRIDARFVEMDARFASIDARFVEMGARFVEMESNMARGFADSRLEMQREITGLREEVRGEITPLKVQMGDIQGTLKLHSWVSATLVAGVFIPLLQNLAA